LWAKEQSIKHLVKDVLEIGRHCASLLLPECIGPTKFLAMGEVWKPVTSRAVWQVGRPRITQQTQFGEARRRQSGGARGRRDRFYMFCAPPV